LVLGFVGATRRMVDTVRRRRRGPELAGARRLLGRARRELGAGCATHILYGGLMAVRKDFQRARLQWDTQLVVKTEEQTLEVAQSCRAAWSGAAEAALRAVGVEVVRGVNAELNVGYVVCAQSGIEWEGLAWPLTVVWVRETPLKGKRVGQTEQFCVLSTDETLRAKQMRELAHIRWSVENQGFKTLNAGGGQQTGVT